MQMGFTIARLILILNFLCPTVPSPFPAGIPRPADAPTGQLPLIAAARGIHAPCRADRAKRGCRGRRGILSVLRFR